MWSRQIQGARKKHSPRGALGALNPSPKLDEYIGDVALAEKDAAAALQAWHRLLGKNPRHLRVLTKVARVEQQQHHWLEAETAWTAALEEKETAEGLAQRAIMQTAFAPLA